MNEQKERIICFDIDQNKQKINHLMKKNKEQEEKMSSMADTVSTNQTSLETLGEQLEKSQNDLSALSSSVEAIKESLAEVESFEECFPKSYDVMRWNTKVHRNNHARTIPFFFCCKKYSTVKLRFRFCAENPTTQTTTTVQCKLDGNVIYSDTHTWDGETTTFNYDFEHTFTSMKGGHKLFINLTSPASVNTYTSVALSILDLTMEIWGTNVEILTHQADFRVYAAPTKVIMTTQVFDTLPRYSVQTPDENLSFDQSNFKTFCPDYWYQNNPVPFINSSLKQEGVVEYSDLPSFLSPFFSKYNEYEFYQVYVDITDSETEMQTRDLSVIGYALDCDVALNNVIDGLAPARISFSDDDLIWVDHEKDSFAQYVLDRPDIQISQVAGGQRLNNTSSVAPCCYVVCNADGTSYIVSMKFDFYNTKYPKTDLGFGSNPKVYVLPDNKVEVFLKYANDTKRILLEQDSTDSRKFNIVSTEILKNIQGYWKCCNGAHFERVGNEIRFFPQNATTASQTLKLFY